MSFLPTCSLLASAGAAAIVAVWTRHRPGLMALGVAGLAASGAMAAEPAGGLAARGAGLFKQRCAMCHTTAKGAASVAGPNLAGVAGRRSGAAAGYAYSAALAGGKIQWDAASLDAFLAAPGRKAPGSRMAVAVPSGTDRQALVAYLGTLKGS